MIAQPFTIADLPKYHEGMLMVKLRLTNAIESFRGAGMTVAAALFDSPGMSMLASLERSGMIKRIIPISRQAQSRSLAIGALGATAAMIAAAHPDSYNQPHAGMSLIELDTDYALADACSALASDPNVEFASKVPARYLLAGTRSNVPLEPPDATIAAAAAPPASAMWNLQKIRWDQARAAGHFRDADLIKVAVLDTGVDRDHPDLRGRVNTYSFHHPDIPSASGEHDIVGHGTHVSGTIAASIGNALGINGICSCKLFVWKIFTDQTSFTGRAFEYVVDPVMYRRALAECSEQDIQVINLSIGGPAEPDPTEQILFDSLLAGGTTIVAAMGNEREEGSPTSYPSAIPGVVAVGATNIDDTVASFSNRGNHISLCAPGVGIWSTLPTYPGQVGFRSTIGPSGRPVEGKALKRETDYDSWQGTSMATPHVTGAVALLHAHSPGIGVGDVRASVKGTADRVSGMSGEEFHPDYGAGRLNLLRLLTE
jgi:subtilisin family serine protease